MADPDTNAPGLLPLSADEKRVLELHDRLQQLQLETALLRARRDYVPGPPSEEKSTETLQRELLDARARYVLRNDVVASVLSANPILQAVHHGTKASPVERDLLPLLEARDSASGALAAQSAELRDLVAAATAAESRALRLRRESVGLASQMLGLAAVADAERAEALSAGDPAHARQIARLEAEVRLSRQRWRVLKGTASAVVAGSGVDWARDEELMDVVLDPRDDEL
ncbi:centromere protein H (CENP-H)-domain-containing protein [Xylariaceae sp. FL0804]|nr:centromere protein H (CENP-H)-domain-containing protein [Xylariaceae sp. FL0804]